MRDGHPEAVCEDRGTFSILPFSFVRMDFVQAKGEAAANAAAAAKKAAALKATAKYAKPKTMKQLKQRIKNRKRKGISTWAGRVYDQM